MERKLNRSELFSISVLLLYGSFASTKHALLMGRLALPVTALALLFELAVLAVATLLPAAKSVWGFIVSLAPLCAISVRVYGDAVLLKEGDFGYIPFWMLVLSSLILCIYLATKNISATGRVAVIVLICALILLLFLAAVYAKEFNFSNLARSFSDKNGARSLILSSLSELVLIYLAKSFFACEENDRAAKPPLEKPLSAKEKRSLFFKITLLAFTASALLRLGVTSALLSLADSRFFALSNNTAVFAARLLEGINISPLISGGVYVLTLFALAFSLSLTVSFSKEMRKKP